MDISTQIPSQKNAVKCLSKLCNNMHKDKCLSATKSILQKGYWPYHAPLGYTNKNKGVRADRHELVINPEGLLLRQAFKWKANFKKALTTYQKYPIPVRWIQ